MLKPKYTIFRHLLLQFRPHYVIIVNIQNPGIGVFTEKMQDMIMIYNHTAEICFDDKQIYLVEA